MNATDKPIPQPKRRPRWVFPLLLLGQFVVLLLVVELLLSLFYPVPFRRPLGKVPDNMWSSYMHRRSEAPGLKYELTPGATGELRGASIHINSLGFRGKEVEVKKPADTIRIVAMGASVAFGWTVHDDETYPARLEARLNARAQGSNLRYEVLNFGVGGYSTHDEVAALAAKALPLDPDLAIIDFHPNGPETEPVQPLHQVFHAPLWWEHSNLLRLLAYGRRQWGVWTLGGGREYDYLASPEGPHWPRFLRSYDKARDLCAARDIPVVVVMFPTFGGYLEWKDYPYDGIREQVRTTALDHGFIPVDVFPAFASSGYGRLELAADLEHPNAIGLDLAAEQLERAIVEDHERLFHRPAPTTGTPIGSLAREPR